MPLALKVNFTNWKLDVPLTDAMFAFHPRWWQYGGVRRFRRRHVRRKRSFVRSVKRQRPGRTSNEVNIAVKRTRL
jgi:hypothetical protein